jgi:hypothetical protein
MTTPTEPISGTSETEPGRFRHRVVSRTEQKKEMVDAWLVVMNLPENISQGVAFATVGTEEEMSIRKLAELKTE